MQRAGIHLESGGRWGIPHMTYPARPSLVSTYWLHLSTFFRWLIAEGLLNGFSPLPAALSTRVGMRLSSSLTDVMQAEPSERWSKLLGRAASGPVSACAQNEKSGALSLALSVLPVQAVIGRLRHTAKGFSPLASDHCSKLCLTP